APFAEKLSMKAAAFALSDGSRLAAVQKLARVAQWPFEKDGLLHHLPGLMGNWTEARDLPTIPNESFREWWAKREKAKRS
ncbi:MAG TPA: lactate utilization protein LutB domain-containing protein, partial [Terriglobales bacterium]|nr:lactate utilization protein LutB domain-containing protein [Terriglobales bacterium]